MMANNDNQRVSIRDPTEQRYRSLLENDRVQHFLRRNGLTNHGGVPLRKEEVERRLRYIDERNSFDLMAQSVVEKALGIDQPTTKSSQSKTEQNSANGPFVTIYDNPCGITMLYKGPRPSYSKVRGDELVIVQSHTDTDSTTVYKGFIHAADEFTFKSRRLMDRPFSIGIYINGIVDCHLSVCCERGLLKQCHSQLRTSSCQLVSITGGTPCDTCQYNALAESSPFDEEETRPSSTITKGRSDSVRSSSRRSSQIPEESYKPPKKDFKEVENTVPLDINKVVPDLPPGVFFKKDATEDPSKQKNDTNAPSAQTEEAQPIKNEKVVNSEGEATVSTNKQNDSETKIRNVAPTVTDISKEAKEEMQHLLDKYFELFSHQPSSSSTPNHANTQIAASSGTKSAIAHLVQAPPSEMKREDKYQIQVTSPSASVAARESAETFELIWLDANIGGNLDSVESQQKLRAIVNMLRTCHTIDEAIAFIRTVPEKKVYLIISGGLCKDFVKRKEVKKFSQIDSIYIFCTDQPKYLYLKQDKYKVRDVFTDPDPLCDRLKKDTAQTMNNLVHISGTSDTPSTNQSDDSKQQAKQVKFLCSQLHRDLLLSMEYSDDARNDFIAFCSEVYSDNKEELDFIKEFKGYHAGKAIWWYTRETFLYKILNNALYQQDVNLLHKLQFFIKDLHGQIEQLHSYYKPSLGSRTLPVFRGLKMSMADFDAKIRREKNNLIAFDTFLSTSLFEHVAKGFACKDKRPTDESILLRIQINANEIGRPFADIRRLSAIGREGEILLSMGTVFRVVNVATEKNSEGLWIVDLVSANDDDALLKREGQKTQGMLLDFFKKVYLAQLKVDDDRQIAASCVNMASMYFRKEQYQTSLDLYKKSFDKLSKLSSPDPLTMATYKSNIAQAHRALKQTDAALELYKEALETRKKCCQENDPLRINTLHTIGNIYREKEEYDLALETYQQALELQTTQLPTNLEADPSSVAATLIYMAKVLNQQNQHQKALEHFDKALKYQHQHLSKDHPALAFLHNNIGAMYYKIGKYKEALAHHSTCLRIEVDSLPPEHITFIDSYRSMVETCAQLDKHVEALEYAEKLVHQCELHQEQSSEQLEEARELLDRVKTDHDVFNK